MSDLTIVISSSVENNTAGSKTATASCSDAGEDHHAISGGVVVLGDSSGVSVTETRPTGIAGEVPGGWQVAADGPTGDGVWGVRAYAVCALVN